MSSPAPAPATGLVGLPPLGEADGHALRLDPHTERDLWSLILVLVCLRVALWLV